MINITDNELVQAAEIKRLNNELTAWAVTCDNLTLERDLALDTIASRDRNIEELVEDHQTFLVGYKAKYDELQSEYAAAGAAPATKVPECRWSLDDDESNTWMSSCGELWAFVDDGPVENRVTFCHHCGGTVVLDVDKEKK